MGTKGSLLFTRAFHPTTQDEVGCLLGTGSRGHECARIHLELLKPSLEVGRLVLNHGLVDARLGAQKLSAKLSHQLFQRIIPSPKVRTGHEFLPIQPGGMARGMPGFMEESLVEPLRGGECHAEGLEKRQVDNIQCNPNIDSLFWGDRADIGCSIR